MNILITSLVVFALTLIVTKSKVLAGKREFVEQRYESSKVGNQQPGWIHRWWYSIWTCPMCSGFWFAILVAILFPTHNVFVDVLVLFSLNWLIHCLENILFFGSELFETISNLPFDKMGEKFKRTIRILEDLSKLKEK
jgi:hypothetical protein